MIVSRSIAFSFCVSFFSSYELLQVMACSWMESISVFGRDVWEEAS